jgi:hypothetical protein
MATSPAHLRLTAISGRDPRPGFRQMLDDLVNQAYEHLASGAEPYRGP